MGDAGEYADEEDAEECQRLAREVDCAPSEVGKEEPGCNHAEQTEGKLREGHCECVFRAEAGLFVCVAVSMCSQCPTVYKLSRETYRSMLKSP
jgi:hypothetical protein